LDSNIARILKQLNQPTVDAACIAYLKNSNPTITENGLVSELLNTQQTTNINRKSSVICPVIGVYVASSCQLKSCRYHIYNPYSANCLLVHVDRQKYESIDLDSQQYFYSVSKLKLKQLLASAILKIRSTYFRDWAYTENIPTYELFETTKVCCVCESTIFDQPYCVKYGQAWCSYECLEELHQNKVKLEKAFGVKYADLKTYLSKCFTPPIVKEIFELCT
jgi:hypothetical protein